VRAVNEQLSRDAAYTTTLKLLQIMHEKGLVARDESNRSHVYRAAVGEQQTQKTMLKNLMSKAFGGSVSALVVRALSVKRSSKRELAEIRELLDKYEAQQDEAKQDDTERGK
jgi:predicted transcriptional regulator